MGLLQRNRPLTAPRPVTVFWYLLIMASVFTWIAPVLDFSRKSGPGEIIAAIGIATAIFLALVAAVWRAAGAYHVRHPLRMRFCDLPLDIAPRDVEKRRFPRSAVLPLGRSNPTIALKTKIKTTMNRFDIRFVERRWVWWRWRDAPDNTVSIVAISVPEWEEQEIPERNFIGPNTVQKTPNQVGGYIVSIPRAKDWVADQWLWIELEVEAKQCWHGYLSFEGNTDRRVFARAPVAVSNSESELRVWQHNCPRAKK